MISIIQKHKIHPTLVSRLRRYCSKILNYLKIEDKNLTIILLNNLDISALNKKYFNKDKPTNVIAFPFEDSDNLGEIYISVETAIAEASEWEVSLFFEICYLVIHAVLHLLGYDHLASEKDEEIMENKEIEIVQNLNLNIWRKPTL